MLKLILPVVVVMASVFSTQASKKTFIDAAGNKVKRINVTFDRADNKLWIVESGDVFTLQDFTKGIMVSGQREKVCFITPFDTSEKDKVAEKSMVKDEVRITMKHDDFQILKGDILDTSFLPHEAIKRCTKGFKWRMPVHHDDMAEEEGSSFDFWNVWTLCPSWDTPQWVPPESCGFIIQHGC